MWTGVDLKFQYAEFHLEEMERSIQPPEFTAHNAALQANGVIVGTSWQRRFYPCFDAFLSAARSVPSIIEAGLGADEGNRIMRQWFRSLATPEQVRRREFGRQFKAASHQFLALPLTTARDISVHRAGYARAEVAITGRFGVTYVGGPASRVPTSETPQIEGELSWMARPVALEPRWTDFTIDGRPLFAECRSYLNAASHLIADARTLADRVHRTESLTPPPG